MAIRFKLMARKSYLQDREQDSEQSRAFRSHKSIFNAPSISRSYQDVAGQGGDSRCLTDQKNSREMQMKTKDVQKHQNKSSTGRTQVKIR